jgi:hypothetical protein
MLGGFSPAQELPDRIAVDAEKSAELHQLERSMLYRRVEVGVLS